MTGLANGLQFRYGQGMESKQVMRCLGLTNERKRCHEIAGTTGYCKQHELMLSGPGAGAAAGQRQAGRRVRWLDQLLPGMRQGIVQDDAKFDVPRWLKKSSTPDVIDHVLHHQSTLVRFAAAFTLRKRRDPGAVEPLWQVLHQDPVGLVRQQAAVALGKIGTPAVLGPLIEGLWHDVDVGVRQACAVALGNLGYSVAVPDLLNALGREEAAFVRWDCVLALGAVGDRAVEPLLIELADEERAEVVRNACREAIAEIRRRGNGEFS